ncbi:MAG: hypothetical protein QF886_22915, partial [Planctomycetota bacterium]|nr:hypothetical protein [Planctomycetota bacterium]
AGPDKLPEEKPAEPPPVVRSNFGKRLARIQPRAPVRPVPSAPLATEKRTNVLAERIPQISLAPVVVERNPANRVEPIRIPVPKPIALAATSPAPSNQADGLQTQIDFEVQPPGRTPSRHVRLPTPAWHARPAGENGEILRLRRPVRERAEQGRSFDFPTSEVRIEPGAETTRKLATFSAKEWSADRVLSPVEIIGTPRELPAPGSFAGVPSADRGESPESPSSIPELDLLAKDQPALALEILPEVTLKDQFASVRFPAPRPMTQTPSLDPKQLAEAVSDSSLGRESFSLKADDLITRPGKGISKARYPDQSSPKLPASPLPPAQQTEPLPELRVLTNWPRLSTQETDFEHADVYYPLPGHHPPLKLRASEGPTESPRRPQMPAQPKQKLD